jgi:hypothetical protein
MEPETDAVRVKIMPRVTAEPRDLTAFLVHSLCGEVFHAYCAEILCLKTLMVEDNRGQILYLRDFLVYSLTVATCLNVQVHRSEWKNNPTYQRMHHVSRVEN